MNKIKEIINYIEKIQRSEATGHDFFHTMRVYKTALKLCENTKANKDIVSYAALLHDIADYKLNNGDETLNIIKAKEVLIKFDVNKETVDEVISIIDSISFKDEGIKEVSSLEGMIVKDADRLDALGANGIARLFAYGGSLNRVIFDDLILPEVNLSKEQYKNKLRNTTSFNHFYEKILKLKDLMMTENGKEEAKKRHNYIVNFINTFLEENDIESSPNKEYFKI